MTETKRRLKVFLCHTHSDAAAVRDLFRYLRREGVDVWLDKESLLPGADWDLEIRKAVRDSDAVIVYLSKKFNEAGYRQKEVKLALDTANEKPEGEIYIIPARLEECNIPDNLRKWHGVDLFQDGGRQKLIYALRRRGDRIGATLRRHRGAPPVASSTESQGPKKKAETSTARTSNQQLKIVTESYEINPHNGPDIWIDRGIYGQRWYVARGTQRLGHLANMNGYIVLDYLIKNRDKECSYKSLIMEAYPTEWSADIQNYMSILSQIIRDIRLVIEEDPDDPKLLIDTGTGFRLNL